jgi:AcrR family transcriptional regulator
VGVFGEGKEETGNFVDRETQRRRQIVDAAVGAVTELGVERATYREIARRANCSTGMLSHYYRNKKELMEEALSVVLEDYRQQLASLIRMSVADSKGRRYLANLFRASFTPPGSPWAFMLEYYAQATRVPDLESRHTEDYLRSQALLADSVTRTMRESGVNAEVDPVLVADFLLALISGLGVRVAVNGRVFPRERALEIASLALSLLGIGADTTAPELDLMPTTMDGSKGSSMS